VRGAINYFTHLRPAISERTPNGIVWSPKTGYDDNARILQLASEFRHQIKNFLAWLIDENNRHRSLY